MEQFSYTIYVRNIARYKAIPLDMPFLRRTKTKDGDGWVPVLIPFSELPKSLRMTLSPDAVFGKNIVVLVLNRGAIDKPFEQQIMFTREKK